MKKSNFIEKWFFIRYNDPDPHIRLRFLLTRISNLSQVVETLHDSFEELQSQNLIWKIQTETYIRELERYGPSNYELTESIFEADSELILNYLSLKNLFETENTSLFFSFMAIDSLLNSFHLTLKDKVYLLESMQHSFKKEFECDNVLKKELDKNFRLLSNEMYLILNANDNGYQPLAEIIEFKELQIKSTVRSILTN